MISALVAGLNSSSFPRMKSRAVGSKFLGDISKTPG